MNASSLLVLLFCLSSALGEVPVAKNCPEGWKWFPRSRGGWCIKPFAATDTIDEAGAEAKCQAEGALLSGVQNKEEIKWISTTLQSLTKVDLVLYWVGAKRAKICEKTGITKLCTASNSFYWIDKSTVGIQGFVWAAGEPNNYGGDQGCIAMASSTNLMDDYRCTDKVKAFVCGKVASFD